MQQNVTVDWHLKESARGKLRVLVRRILKKFGYPPDRAPAAINTVLTGRNLVTLVLSLNCTSMVVVLSRLRSGVLGQLDGK
ncbi:type I restriction enzyme endonuclease domain-containing protein [Cochlodiniinecator piscidefendens]|uniref:type I restriction enzyme endonuclease domain-containing protein n=1 Tax=Cochlodiniinecator piscidefendens TaxID=2715756 RepID=UPI00197C54E5|nr:type I restriction enzyme endonuclease domain-containing protein [Cochlodiniinecator piscidefendens]